MHKDGAIDDNGEPKQIKEKKKAKVKYRVSTSLPSRLFKGSAHGQYNWVQSFFTQRQEIRSGIRGWSTFSEG